MKLDLELFGINLSASPAGVALSLDGSATRFSRAEFGALVHALSSIQELLEGIPAQTSVTLVRPETVAAPVAAVAAAPGAKKRGRPPKTSTATPFAAAAAPAAPAKSAAVAVTLAPGAKKRGRPPKTALATPATHAAAASAAPVVVGLKKRGRPPKGSAIAYAAPQAPASAAAAIAIGPTGKKRGRPPQGARPAIAAVAAPAAAAAISGGKLRGRPPKSAGSTAASTAPEQADGGKRGSGRPRTDGTPVGAPRLVELVDAWMAKNPGPKSVAELAEAATANGWVEAAQATELLERHVPRAPNWFVRMPDGRFRRRADKTPVEAPKAAKVLRRRGQNEIAIVRVEAPGT